MGLTPTRVGKLLHKGAEVDWAIIDDESRRVLAVEAKWGELSAAEVERLSRRIKALTHALLPGNMRDYDVRVAVYARSAPKHVGDVEVITPEDMPWGRACATD